MNGQGHCLHCQACTTVTGATDLPGDPQRIRHANLLGATWTQVCPACHEADRIAERIYVRLIRDRPPAGRSKAAFDAMDFALDRISDTFQRPSGGAA